MEQGILRRYRILRACSHLTRSVQVSYTPPCARLQYRFGRGEAFLSDTPCSDGVMRTKVVCPPSPLPGMPHPYATTVQPRWCIWRPVACGVQMSCAAGVRHSFGVLSALTA